MVSLGQISIALAGPIALVAPPRISAAWFATEERTLATGISSGINSPAVTFIVAPQMVRIVGIRWWLIIQAAGGAFLFLMGLCYFPNAPPSPPTISAKISEKDEVKFTFRNYLSGIREILKIRSVVLLAVIIGWQSGSIAAWQGLLDFLLGKFYSVEFIGILGFLNASAAVAGSIIGGYLCDKFFQRKFKAVIIVCYILAIIFFSIFTICFPSFISEKPILDVVPFPWVPAVLVIIIGVVFGIVYPVFLELAAEISFPMNEFYSAAVITLLYNICALIVLLAGSYIPSEFVSGGVTASLILCTILMIFVKEEYRRLDVDFGGKNDEIE